MTLRAGALIFISLITIGCATRIYRASKNAPPDSIIIVSQKKELFKHLLTNEAVCDRIGSPPLVDEIDGVRSKTKSIYSTLYGVDFGFNSSWDNSLTIYLDAGVHSLKVKNCDPCTRRTQAGTIGFVDSYGNTYKNLSFNAEKGHTYFLTGICPNGDILLDWTAILIDKDKGIVTKGRP